MENNKNMEENNFFQMYIDELEFVSECTAEETKELLEKVKSGNGEAKKRLIEGHLKSVLNYVKEYATKSKLPINDLIQEGNIALTLFVDGYEKEADHFQKEMLKMVDASLKAADEEQSVEENIEEEVTARVNVLQTVSQVMAKELGREASVTELAERMKMTEEEVKGIMKLTLDAMSVNVVD